MQGGEKQHHIPLESWVFNYPNKSIHFCRYLLNASHVSPFPSIGSQLSLSKELHLSNDFQEIQNCPRTNRSINNLDHLNTRFRWASGLENPSLLGLLNRFDGITFQSDVQEILSKWIAGKCPVFVSNVTEWENKILVASTGRILDFWRWAIN